MPVSGEPGFVRAAKLEEVRAAGCRVVRVGGQTVALFFHGGRVHAVDNRCPHMGFPLDRGTVGDGILTCHWHHARFDLATGGTFDPWADDVRVFPVEVREGEVWVDPRRPVDPLEHQRRRVRDGLERNLPLVIAKAAIHLLDAGEGPAAPFRIGLEFGSSYRAEGWGQGLTILTCMMNLVPALDAAERPRALYHGLSAVASDSAGQAPRFSLRPLPDTAAGPDTFKRWFRRFVEVRDAEGAERCLVSALRAGADGRAMADMLFAAATDHRYIRTGHVLDFTNKALEALDAAGWEHAEAVLPGLASGYASADRMEESNAWRHPVDLVAILEEAFERLPDAAGHGGRPRRGERARPAPDALVEVVQGDDPGAIAEALLEALRGGAAGDDLAAAVVHSAALRLARFHTSNEFSDWDRALHTFTFANAVHQGMRRAGSVELLRGVFDAAMSVYLDRFLNVPAAKLPEVATARAGHDGILTDLPALLDRQQQVNEAGAAVARYLGAGGEPDRLLATLGRLLLREDRDFHTIQAVEAAFRQFELRRSDPRAAHFLIAAARYLAAHAPTVRAEGQTFEIALRLHRGEHLYEETATDAPPP